MRALLAALVGALLLGTPAWAAAQDPPDTLVVRDTVPPTDSLGLQVPADSASADSLEVRVLPLLPGAGPVGSEVGAWRWDREALLGSPAFTLLELLDEIPGLLPLRFGDYGAPEGLLVPGLGGGGVRVFVDGFETTPLDGSIPDLSRVVLGALSEVRAERVAGELRVHLVALRPEDPRPLSMIEAGTGDLDTNLFRGTFVHPRALGGSLGLVLERVDTRGTRGEEDGSRQGIWLRYGIHRGEDAGLTFDLRRSLTQASLAGIPPEVSRVDWVVRGRLRLTSELVAEAFTGSSSLGSEADGLTPVEGSRRQHGLRLGFERGPVWARMGGRVLSGPDLPSLRMDGALGSRLPGWGGVALDWGLDRWEGKTALSRSLRLWTEARYGVSAFVGLESGERGARTFEARAVLPPPDTGQAGGDPGEAPSEEEDSLPPTHRLTDLSTLRIGGRLELGPLDITAAWLKTKIDSVLPLGLLLDREAGVFDGGEVTGFELAGSLALPVSGFSLVGSLLQWKEEGIYRPGRVYQGGLAFHDIFMESGNLEIWGGLQVEGRDPMVLPFVEGEGDDLQFTTVPFYQSWNGHFQIRILALRIFIRWDNAFLRSANQDFPERILPETRALYGVRWTLWN